MPSTLTTPKPMSFVPEDTKYKQYQGQIDPGFGPGPIGSKPPATVESKKTADARIIAMKEAEAMANKAIAGKGVQNPTVTPAAPPKGYVDDLDYLNKPLPTKAMPIGPMSTSSGFNPPPGFNPDAKKIRQQKIATGEYKPATTYSGMRTDGGPGVPGSMYMKKGGSFKTTKMSTHEKNPKHKNCW
jgi:hypothetical protein